MNTQQRIEQLEKKLNELKAKLNKHKRWKPEIGSGYYTLDSANKANLCVSWNNDEIDQARYLTHNCFQTEAEAQAIADQKRKKFEILAEVERLNDGWVADWEDENQNKFSIFYRHLDKKFDVSNWMALQNMCVYLKSEQAAQSLIDKFGDDLKVLFTPYI